MNLSRLLRLALLGTVLATAAHAATETNASAPKPATPERKAVTVETRARATLLNRVMTAANRVSTVRLTDRVTVIPQVARREVRVQLNVRF